MPIITSGGNVDIQGGYNDVARDMYNYSDNAAHHHHTNNNACGSDCYNCISWFHFLPWEGAHNSRLDNGQRIRDTRPGLSITLTNCLEHFFTVTAAVSSSTGR